MCEFQLITPSLGTGEMKACRACQWLTAPPDHSQNFARLYPKPVLQMMARLRFCWRTSTHERCALVQ